MTGIRDLARHLDISIGTVSRALNDRADVNPQTRDRVREAATRLGYSPNQSGRSLRRGRTELVGVIIPTGREPNLINPVFLSVLDGLRRRLSEQRLDLAVFLHGPEDPLMGSLRRLTERGLVDGLIIADTQRIDPRIDYLLERRRPFAAFGRSLSGGDHAWVDPDFEGAVQSAVDMLSRLGHRRIALMAPIGETYYLHLIIDAYRRAMKKNGFPIARDFIQRLPVGEDGGYEAGGNFLRAEIAPTAILFSDDLQSVGLYRKFSECDLRFAGDVSVVGILPDNRAQRLSPVLTTFQTDWTAIGVRLGEALIGSMAHPCSALPQRGGEMVVKPEAAPPIQCVMPVNLREGRSVHRIATV